MHPWIIQKIREQEQEEERKKRVQPRLPAPEPFHQIAPSEKKDGEGEGIVSVDYEL